MLRSGRIIPYSSIQMEGSMTNLDAGEPVQEFVDSDPPIASVGGVVYRWTAVGQLEILLIKKQGGFWTLPKRPASPAWSRRRCSRCCTRFRRPDGAAARR